MRYLLAACGLLLVGYLLTGVTQIRPGERAVVRRFGKIVDVRYPGLHVGLPAGMDRVDRVPADLVRRVEVGYPQLWDEDGSTPPGQLLTGDHNLINARVVLTYSVAQENKDTQWTSQEERVVDFVLHADRSDTIVARAAESLLAEWVAQRSVDSVLLTGKALLPRWLVERTRQRIAPYRLGIRIQSASVDHLLPPDQVKPAFDAVTQAQTGIRTKENKARQEAARLVRNAEIQRVELEQAAAAQVNATLKLAQTEAGTFTRRLQQYQRIRQQNPQILTVIWWDEMGRLFFRFKDAGRIDILDNHLAADGLDITLFFPQPKKR